MQRMELRGRWALVTGASSGLGREIARELARKHGANVALVARRKERLDALADELRGVGVQAECIVADLALPAQVDHVFEQSTAGRDIYAVVLNAGLTHFGHHQELPWEQFERMLATNVTGSVRLVHRYVPYLIERNQGGGIMLVTSMTGLIPVPFQTAYSATKSFLTAFGQGLYHELDGKNVSLTTFAPGGIVTEMTESNGLNDHFRDSIQMMSAPRCAEQAVDAMVRRRYLSVPGRFNRLQLLLPRMLPRKLVGNVLASTYRKALSSRQE